MFMIHRRQKRHFKTILLIFRLFFHLCTNLLRTDVNEKCKKLCVTGISKKIKKYDKTTQKKDGKVVKKYKANFLYLR